jgi:tetratricopeptide (TPR) repeat protein
MAYAMTGDDDAAVREFRRALEMAPDDPEVLGTVSRGNHDAARQYHARALAISGEDNLLLDRAVVALRTGDRAAADELLHRLEARVRRTWEECAGTCANDVLAASLALRGQRDEALRYLQRAVDNGWRGIHNFESRLGRFDELADEPRYQRLIAQIRVDLQRQRASLAREGL